MRTLMLDVSELIKRRISEVVAGDEPLDHLVQCDVLALLGQRTAEQLVRVSHALSALLRGHGWTSKKSVHVLEQASSRLNRHSFSVQR
ncbi:hypothetical protein [Mesorhizobium sp.]|uniref:hypothetical protein n=1 Tax=Mesorhizobium sp. TaxID=1871066 RepID=UPI000FE68577|nr:hypothetical protein [Mesorhizobium sp.]RWQ15475.1 MAG: hypothetical protein EOR93_25905 [Mesorhizobium sp.]